MADREGAAKAAAVPSAPPGPSFSVPLADTAAPSASLPSTPLAGNRRTPQHDAQLLALIRALARDAARADHAAKRGAHDE